MRVLILVAILLSSIFTEASASSKYAIIQEKTDEEKIKISLNFKEVPLRDAIISICSQTGINVTLSKDIDQLASVSAYYEGVSLDEALRAVVSGLDISVKKEGNMYFLTPFEERLFDVNKITVMQGGTLSTSTSMPPSPPGTGGTTTQQPQSPQPQPVQQQGQGGDDEGVNSIISAIRSLLSPRGTVSYLPTGFIYVKDTPSRIKAIESVLNMDTAKRKETKLKITLIRIDYKKEYETGIDWSAVFGGIKDNLPFKIETGGRFLGNLAGDSGNAFIRLANSKNTLSSVIKALSAYGDVNIVHTWESRAMSGVTLPFELTQDVWYNQGTTVQIVNNQTITSQQIGKESVGVKITLTPVLQQDGKYIVNTWVELSNIVGFQKIGDQELPQTERNFTRIPIKMEKSDTAVISGFKIKNKDVSSEGIPFFANLPILKHIFGYTKTADRVSELSIIISMEE